MLRVLKSISILIVLWATASESVRWSCIWILLLLNPMVDASYSLLKPLN